MTVDLQKGTVQLTEKLDPIQVEDDFKRELSFYQQALAAASSFRSKVIELGKAFSRPTEYFADMFKNVSHMTKITKRQEESEAAAKRSALAKQQRLNKKFGKQVQVAKEQQKMEHKRKTLSQIESFKKKRKNSGDKAFDAEQDFDIEVGIDEPERRLSTKNNRTKTKGSFERGKKRSVKSRPGKKTRQMNNTKKMKSLVKNKK